MFSEYVKLSNAGENTACWKKRIDYLYLQNGHNVVYAAKKFRFANPEHACIGITSHEMLPVSIWNVSSATLSKKTLLASPDGRFVRHIDCKGKRKASGSQCSKCCELDRIVGKIKCSPCQGISLEKFDAVVKAKKWDDDRAGYVSFILDRVEGKIWSNSCQFSAVGRQKTCQKCYHVRKFLNKALGRLRKNASTYFQ